MKRSLLGRTFAQWIVKGLLVLVLVAALVVGLAFTIHPGHGSDVAPGGCGGCNHYTMVTSGSGTRVAPW